MHTFLLLGLTAASYTDWRKRTIPNVIPLPLMLTGIVWQASAHGMDGFISSCVGLLTGILLLWLPFALGGMGGGDVKLLGAVGSFTGVAGVAQVFLISAIIGGLACGFETLRRKTWKQTLCSLQHRMVFAFLHQRLPSESEVPMTQTPVYLPYAAFILCGYVLTALYGGNFPWIF